jgi:hypothetical protein
MTSHATVSFSLPTSTADEVIVVVATLGGGAVAQARGTAITTSAENPVDVMLRRGAPRVPIRTHLEIAVLAVDRLRDHCIQRISCVRYENGRQSHRKGSHEFRKDGPFFRRGQYHARVHVLEALVTRIEATLGA